MDLCQEISDLLSADSEESAPNRNDEIIGLVIPEKNIYEPSDSLNPELELHRQVVGVDDNGEPFEDKIGSEFDLDTFDATADAVSDIAPSFTHVKPTNLEAAVDSFPDVKVENEKNEIKSRGPKQGRRGRTKTTKKSCKNDSSADNNSELENDKKARTRASVAASSRKLRAKRKMERIGLIERNDILEDEQGSFRATIAELQMEITNLRNTQCAYGNVNLRTENLLLRAELKRHKTFMHHINAMMNDFPQRGMGELEKDELIKSGIDSAVGQLVGLLYTSMIDSDGWQVTEFYPTYLKHLNGVKVVLRSQLLPIGCTPENACRLNIREDVYNIPEEALDFVNKNLLRGKDIELIKEYFHVYREKSKHKKEDLDLSVMELDFGAMSINDKKDEDHACTSDNDTRFETPLQKHKIKNNVQVAKYKQTIETGSNGSASSLEYVAIRADVSDIRVKSRAFPPLDDVLKFYADTSLNENAETVENQTERNTENQEISINMMVQSTAPSRVSPAIFPKTDGVERFEENETGASIIRDLPTGGKIMTHVASVPLVKNVPYCFKSKEFMLQMEENEYTPQGIMPSAVRIGWESVDSFIADYLYGGAGEKGEEVD